MYTEWFDLKIKKPNPNDVILVTDGELLGTIQIGDELKYQGWCGTGVTGIPVNNTTRNWGGERMITHWCRFPELPINKG